MKPTSPEQSLPLAKMDPQAVDIAPQGISVEAAFAAASSKALDKESLAVMERLIAIDAERKFNVAFVAMQSEIPVIVAESAIPNRGKYQRYEDIMQKDGVAKILSRHGFCVAFEQEYRDNIITVTCILRHAGGHSHRTPFSVRVSGKADSETQADCKASTTAKRNALCQALNITIRQDALMNEDEDASLLGDTDTKLSEQLADELERRVAMLNFTPAQVVSFLKFYGGDSCRRYADIPANKYDAADKFLATKEKAGK